MMSRFLSLVKSNYILKCLEFSKSIFSMRTSPYQPSTEKIFDFKILLSLQYFFNAIGFIKLFLSSTLALD
jgi:hypothetical protein